MSKALTLTERHAVIDAQVDALPDSVAIELATVAGATPGTATANPSAARDYLKAQHPDDAERVLIDHFQALALVLLKIETHCELTEEQALELIGLSDQLYALGSRLPDNVGAPVDTAGVQPEVTLTEAETLAIIADRSDQKPAVTCLRLAEAIGSGSHLFAVCVKGEDWDGSAQWLVRGDHFKDALATALAQYDDLPEDQRPDSWDGVMVGEFV